ncbi:hypothetical protein KR222_003855 [Zaprionus bogoriensis]|nr:hypothetical protein KR222_003855 [Zaprionus bogoriensis]
MTTVVRELKEEDFEGFKSFLLEHFYGHEPLMQTPGDHKKVQVTPERWEERLQIVRQGLSLIAVDQQGCIVGTAFAESMQPADLEKSWETVNRQRPTDLLAHTHYFLSRLERESRVFQHYNVSEALYLCILTVDASVRRQGLGRRLVSGLMELGRSKGFPLLVTTCTSLFSQRVMEAHGLEVVLSQKYADYTIEDGSAPIRPPLPHTEASVMAIRL